MELKKMGDLNERLLKWIEDFLIVFIPIFSIFAFLYISGFY